MSSDVVLLVKLDNKNLKLSFPTPPKVSQVAAEVARTNKLGPEWRVLLSCPDPDFPDSGDVVLKEDVQLSNKQVLRAITELKEVSSWSDVDCPERGKAILKDNGITPAVAGCLVHILGYTEPEDLEHVDDELLDKLPLKPLEKNRLVKLIESVKSNSAPSGVARAPSARFVSKVAGASTIPVAKPAEPTRPPAAAASSKSVAAPPAAASSKSTVVRISADAKPGQLKASTDKPAPPSLRAKSCFVPKSSSPAPQAAAPPPPPAAPAAEQPPAPPARPTKPPADEDEDEMLARILAEGEEEKAAPDVDKEQSKFTKPMPKSELVATLEGHKESVLALALSQDGNTLFTASGDNTIKVWSLKGYFLQQTLTDHATSVGVLALDHNNKHLISGSGDGMVIVWDISEGKAEKSFEDTESHAYGIVAMTLANKQALLFTATGDKKIRGFQIKYKQKKLTLAMEMQGHLEIVRSMVLSADDNVLYSASEDATIKVWHANAEVGYKFAQAVRGHEAAVFGLDLSRDGSMLVSCSADKTITIYQLTTISKSTGKPEPLPAPKIKQVLTGHKGDINCVVFNEDNTRLVSSGDDKTIRIWGQLAGSKEPCFALQQTLEGHALIVYPILLSKDGKMVVSGSADNTARVWRLAE